MSDGSFIPDSIGATLADLVGLYSQVEAVKLNNQLALARASAAGVSLPTVISNPQATQGVAATGGISSQLLIVGAILAAGVVLYIAVK